VEQVGNKHLRLFQHHPSQTREKCVRSPVQPAQDSPTKPRASVASTSNAVVAGHQASPEQQEDRRNLSANPQTEIRQDLQPARLRLRRTYLDERDLNQYPSLAAYQNNGANS